MLAAIRGVSFRALGAPLVVAVAVVGALVAVIVLSQTLGDAGAPAKAPPFVLPAASPITPRDVKQRDGGQLTLIKQLGETAVEEKLTLTPAIRVERLRLITAADVRAGDWVSVIGIINEVKNFSIHSIVVMDAPASPPAEGFARSAGGFAGYEITRDPRDRPLIGGVVDRVEGKDIILKGPTGEIIVRAGLEAAARLFRLEPASSEALQEGDRVAAAFDTGGPPASLLVLPAQK